MVGVPSFWSPLHRASKRRFSCGRGARLRTWYAPRLAPSAPLHPAHVSNGAAFSPSAFFAECEPQTLQTLFSGRTVVQCCAVAPPVLGFGWEGPVLPLVADGVTNREGITSFPDHNNTR